MSIDQDRAFVEASQDQVMAALRDLCLADPGRCFDLVNRLEVVEDTGSADAIAGDLALVAGLAGLALMQGLKLAAEAMESASGEAA